MQSEFEDEVERREFKYEIGNDTGRRGYRPHKESSLGLIFMQFEDHKRGQDEDQECSNEMQRLS